MSKAENTIDVISLASGNSNKDKQISANDLLMDFVSIMVHDLQAPLASMKTLVRFLEMNKYDPENQIHRNLVKSTSIALKRSESIIYDMFDASKAEQIGIPFKLETIKINDVIDNSIDMINASALEYGITIVRSLLAINLSVQADRNLLLRVIDNLLFNAFKHSSNGSNVYIKTEHAGKEVIISITDEGPGIKDINPDDLFDKYKQMGLRKEGKYKGVGLGLYFCRLAIQAMGGRIWAENHETGGASFKFALMYRKG
ncbi:MAG: hypothetical protein J7K40_14110 [candidate division Zixibacteria bacterium]|nr:hypothetical protein [candidate division Zixibacteria bacterium]